MRPCRRAWRASCAIVMTALLVALFPGSAHAATGDPTVDCTSGASGDTLVKNYPGRIPLRCGNSKKGYQHILRRHGWNSKMNLCIEATLASAPYQPVNGDYGRHVRYFNSNQVMLEFRVFRDMSPAAGGPFGVVTAYNNSRDMGVNIPDYECGLK